MKPKLLGGRNVIRLKVRKVAEAQGVETPGRLARESRVSYGTVHRLWNEPDKVGSGITLDVLWRIAQALGVKTSDLYEEDAPGRWTPALLAA